MGFQNIFPHPTGAAVACKPRDEWKDLRKHMKPDLCRMKTACDLPSNLLHEHSITLNIIGHLYTLFFLEFHAKPKAQEVILNALYMDRSCSKHAQQNSQQQWKVEACSSKPPYCMILRYM